MAELSERDLYIVRVFDGRAALHFGPLQRHEATELRDALRAANPQPSVNVRRLISPTTAVEAGDKIALLLEAAQE